MARSERESGASVSWDDGDVDIVISERRANLDFVRELWGGSEHHEMLRDEAGVVLAKQRAFGRDEFHFAVALDVNGTALSCTDGTSSHIRDQADAELAIRVCQSVR